MEQVVLNQPLLASTIIIPMVAATLSLILGDRLRPKMHAAMNSGALLYSLIVYLGLTWKFGADKFIRDSWVWSPASLGHFTLVLDPVPLMAVIGISLVTALVALYSVPYMRHRLAEMEEEGVSAPGWGAYYFLYTLFAASMLGTVLSTNTVEFYLFLELTLIPSFLLIAFYGYGDRIRIALLYLIWTHVGAVLFLVGILALGMKAGFDFYDPQGGGLMLGFGESLEGSLAKVVFWLMTLGLLVKMAVLGVHIWLPYAHAEAPTPISALLSPNLIGIGGIMLLRIVYTALPTVFEEEAGILVAWALATMIYGGLMALMQSDFKRLLAYSSVSQMGYLLLGIASASVYGMAGSVLHYLVHAYGKAILFMVAGILIVRLGLRDITKMGGLASRMPYTAALALLGFMHITGIPPTLGLWSEYLIVRGAVEYSYGLGALGLGGMGAALLVGIGLSTAYAFVTMRKVFYGPLRQGLRGALEAGPEILVPVVLVAAAGVLSFFAASWLLDPLINSLSSIYG